MMPDPDNKSTESQDDELLTDEQFKMYNSHLLTDEQIKQFQSAHPTAPNDQKLANHEEAKRKLDNHDRILHNKFVKEQTDLIKKYEELGVHPTSSRVVEATSAAPYQLSRENFTTQESALRLALLAAKVQEYESQFLTNEQLEMYNSQLLTDEQIKQFQHALSTAPNDQNSVTQVDEISAIRPEVKALANHEKAKRELDNHARILHNKFVKEQTDLIQGYIDFGVRPSIVKVVEATSAAPYQLSRENFTTQESALRLALLAAKVREYESQLSDSAQRELLLDATNASSKNPMRENLRLYEGAKIKRNAKTILGSLRSHQEQRETKDLARDRINRLSKLEQTSDAILNSKDHKAVMTLHDTLVDFQRQVSNNQTVTIRKMQKALNAIQTQSQKDNPTNPSHNKLCNP